MPTGKSKQETPILWRDACDKQKEEECAQAAHTCSVHVPTSCSILLFLIRFVPRHTLTSQTWPRSEQESPAKLFAQQSQMLSIGCCPIWPGYGLCHWFTMGPSCVIPKAMFLPLRGYETARESWNSHYLEPETKIPCTKPRAKQVRWQMLQIPGCVMHMCHCTYVWCFPWSLIPLNAWKP